MSAALGVLLVLLVLGHLSAPPVTTRTHRTTPSHHPRRWT